MVNDGLVRVRGKPNTEYEGKGGTAPKMSLFNIRGIRLSLIPDTPLLVLWDGDKEKTLVRLGDLELIG